MNKSTGIYGHFGDYVSSAQLPNVAGATVQTAELSVGALATAADTVYVCTTATLGAAVWAVVGGAGAGSTTLYSAWSPTVTDNNGIYDGETILAAGWQRVAGIDYNGRDVIECGFYSLFTSTAGGTPDLRLTGLPAPIYTNITDANVDGVFAAEVGNSIDADETYALTPQTSTEVFINVRGVVGAGSSSPIRISLRYSAIAV